MKAICIIPARGGSKRLPRKNVIDFFGKPMIAYSIEAAISSKRFSRIVVSSVANSKSLANTSEPVTRLNSVDFPALV